MKKLVGIAGLALVGAFVTGCATTPMSEKISTWQKERPYADKIQAVRDSGRKLQNSDVDLIFTLEEFKKELPDASASIEAVLTLSKTALNIGAELGNSSSPLYVAAVDSVDRKWVMYVGRDVETDAGGDINKYLEKLEPEYRAQAKKDWEAYQKIIKYVPDPAALARGKKVCERYYTKDDQGNKVLDVAAIEMLPYTGKPGEKEDYSAFLVYRDNTPEVQKEYDNALKAKLTALMARVQVQMNELLDAVQKLKEDPQVNKLNMMDLGMTLKGMGVGIGKVFADPLGKLNGALDGYALADEIDKLVAETQKIEQSEANKAKKD